MPSEQGKGKESSLAIEQKRVTTNEENRERKRGTMNSDDTAPGAALAAPGVSPIPPGRTDSSRDEAPLSFFVVVGFKPTTTKNDNGGDEHSP